MTRIKEGYVQEPVDNERLASLTEYYKGDYGDDANIRDLVAAVRDRDEKIETLRSAVRSVLGWFALYNRELDRKKWPHYISICEKALKTLKPKGGA